MPKKVKPKEDNSSSYDNSSSDKDESVDRVDSASTAEVPNTNSASEQHLPPPAPRSMNDTESNTAMSTLSTQDANRSSIMTREKSGDLLQYSMPSAISRSVTGSSSPKRYYTGANLVSTDDSSESLAETPPPSYVTTPKVHKKVVKRFKVKVKFKSGTQPKSKVTSSSVSKKRPKSRDGKWSVSHKLKKVPKSNGTNNSLRTKSKSKSTRGGGRGDQCTVRKLHKTTKKSKSKQANYNNNTCEKSYKKARSPQNIDPAWMIKRILCKMEADSMSSQSVSTSEVANKPSSLHKAMSSFLPAPRPKMKQVPPERLKQFSTPKFIAKYRSARAKVCGGSRFSSQPKPKVSHKEETNGKNVNSGASDNGTTGDVKFDEKTMKMMVNLWPHIETWINKMKEQEAATIKEQVNDKSLKDQQAVEKTATTTNGTNSKLEPTEQQSLGNTTTASTTTETTTTNNNNNNNNNGGGEQTVISPGEAPSPEKTGAVAVKQITNDEMEDLNDEITDLNTSINTLKHSYGSIIQSLVNMQNRRAKRTMNLVPVVTTMKSSGNTIGGEQTRPTTATVSDIVERVNTDYSQKYNLDRFLDSNSRDEVFKELFTEVNEINQAMVRFRTFFDNEGYFQAKVYQAQDEFVIDRPQYEACNKVVGNLSKAVTTILKAYNTDMLDMFRLNSSTTANCN